MGWDYKITTIPLQYGKPDTKSAQEIAKLGDDGWELVCVTPVLEKGNTLALLHHMRRPKEQKQRVGFSAE